MILTSRDARYLLVASRGDKNRYLHREPVTVIDLRQQIPGFGVDLDRIQGGAYVFVLTDNAVAANDWRARIEANRIIDSNGIEAKQQRRRLVQFRREPELFRPVESADVVGFEERSIEAAAKTLDRFAWTGGAVTVGGGGDYATWELLATDMGTFTSRGEATGISDTTEANQQVFDGDVSTFGMELNGGGFLVTQNQTQNGLALNWGGTGSSNICCFVIRRNQAAAANARGLISVSGGSSPMVVRKNKLYHTDAAHQGCGITNYNTGLHRISSNVIYNVGNSGIVQDILNLVGAINPNSVWENNVVYNCGADGIDDDGIFANGETFILRNNACFDNAGDDFASVASITNYATSKNASSDATGSEVALRNLVAATVWESVTAADADFLYPVKTEALYGAGIDPDETEYYNNRTIVPSVGVDIGALGYQRIIIDSVVRAGNSLDIAGSGFIDGTVVAAISLAGAGVWTNAIAYTSRNATTITGALFASIPPGTYDVRVTNLDGVSTIASGAFIVPSTGNSRVSMSIGMGL